MTWWTSSGARLAPRAKHLNTSGWLKGSPGKNRRANVCHKWRVRDTGVRYSVIRDILEIVGIIALVLGMLFVVTWF